MLQFRMGVAALVPGSVEDFPIGVVFLNSIKETCTLERTKLQLQIFRILQFLPYHPEYFDNTCVYY